MDTQAVRDYLLGLQAMYLALSPAVQSADPALHDQLTALFAGLLGSVYAFMQFLFSPLLGALTGW